MPGAPEWLGGLGRVTAGMGLRMQLGGDQPYLWRRSTEPTRGLVKLRTGWNLVAWSGADGAAIGDVVKGIGWSLRTVRRWDPATQEWIVWTSPERSAQVIANTGADQETDDDAETPGIRRGEALWIEVARAVNWLQPTGIIPRLVFPGGASQALQARVREDLQATLAFFRDHYGIQADTDFTIYAAKDVDSLIQAYDEEGEVLDEAYTRALWSDAWVEGWGGSTITVKQSSWNPYLLTHEYFHVLQQQLSRRVDVPWLVEGTAEWAEGEHQVLDGGETRGNLRDGISSAISNDTPTLRSTESSNARWEYYLGWLATDRLIRNAGADSWIEFWRQFAPTEIGPHRRWISPPDWQTVFQGVFGRPVSEFYADFDAWQREQGKANPTTTNSYDGNWIRGRVKDEDGGPVAGVFVNAIRVEGETSVGWNQRAETGDDGTFAVRAPVDGDYRLSIDIADDCRRYYSDGELIDDHAEAQPIAVTGTDVREIDFHLPPNVCGWQIRGRVVGPNAEPLAGVRVTAHQTGSGDSRSSTSAADGSFAVTVNEPGEYHIGVILRNACSVYFRAGGSASTWSDASTITVVDAHVSGIVLRVQEDMCAHQIKGTITQANGQPLADTYVSACLEENGDCVAWIGRRTDDDGAFKITVPTDGAYHLSFNLGGCTIYFSPDSLTTTRGERPSVRVEGGNVRLSQRQIPEGGDVRLPDHGAHHPRERPAALQHVHRRVRHSGRPLHADGGRDD